MRTYNLLWFLAVVCPGVLIAQSNPPSSSVLGGTTTSRAKPSCASVPGLTYGAPSIEITKKSSAIDAGGSGEIVGYIEGVCLAEAGLYRNGDKYEEISIEALPTFKRFPFDISVPNGRKREIRAYDNLGHKTSYSLKDSRNGDDPLGIGLPRAFDDKFGE